MVIRKVVLLLACLSVISPCALGAPAPTWSAAFRYRLEQVDQTGFDHEALAATARLRVGTVVPLGSSWRAFAEGEAIWAMTDTFNSGANGRTAYPAVADASALEVNQAGIAWRAKTLETIVGRQRIVFDNQRFIGNVGWRQNEQTFDAALVAITPSDRWMLHYGWLDRVHRVAGDRARDPLAQERDLDAHLVHATRASGIGPIAFYFYGLEDQDVASASTHTWGVRWTPSGTRDAWHWSAALEAAQQHDAGDNPARFSHGYQLLEGSTGRGTWNARVGWERLAGNGTHALQTPLATLHAFNGWADVFVITPPAGLGDRYVSVTGAWSHRTSVPFDWALAWHKYDPTQAGECYGREWNASLGRKFAHGWSALFKVADYQKASFGRDTRKVWLQVEWSR